MLNIGEAAPDFALPNQDGKTIRLSDYRGKKVILFAFPKANTPGCNMQACAFRDEFSQIEAGNAIVLGISSDPQEALKKWKQKHHLPYDLLSDPKHTVLDKLSAWGVSVFRLMTLPWTVRSYWVIDEAGIIIDAQVGVGPKVSVQKALAAINKSQVAGV